MLICPHCKKELIKEEKRYACENGHHFDIAKQGYTNMAKPTHKQSGDNKEMVQARSAFLKTGLYAPLCDGLIKILQNMNVNTLLDAGCGEGYYTNTIQESLDTKVFAFDMSKEALKVASRKNKNVMYFLSSIFSLPIADESVDVVLSVFAPFAQEEFARVLKLGGYVIKVDPHKKHLYEMKEILYENVYENEVLSINTNEFELEKYEELEFVMGMNQEQLQPLFQMTPYYYKTSIDKKKELEVINGLRCTASFIVYFYKKK